MKIKDTSNEKFIKEVSDGLIKMGATKIKDKISAFRSFELDTIVGKLEIDIDADNQFCYTVFSRFLDVDKAKEKFDCNPYSGKYNIHLTARPIKDVIKTALFHFEVTQP